MDIKFTVSCVHTDLGKNVECEQIDLDVSYLTDSAGIGFKCPECKREIWVKFNFESVE